MPKDLKIERDVIGKREERYGVVGGYREEYGGGPCLRGAQRYRDEILRVKESALTWNKRGGRICERVVMNS